MDITKPPFIDRYPELAGFTTSDTRPRLNRAERNLAVRCGSFSNGNWEIRDCLSVTEDPGFEDAKAGDFRLGEDTPLLKLIPGFKPIPFEQIGLYLDNFRTSLPRAE